MVLMRTFIIALFFSSVLFYFIAKDKGNYIHQVSVTELYLVDSVSLKKWSYKDTLYLKEEISKAIEFSNDSIGLTEGESSEQKMHKIASFLIQRFYKQLGSPSDDFRQRSPWAQFVSLRADTTLDLYCTHFSAMYAFFARVNGLSIREIECKGMNDLHIFNEVYLPEKKKWVYSDLTHGIIALKKGDMYVSTVEMYNQIHQSELDTFEIVSVRDILELNRSYQEVKKSLLFSYDAQCAFYFYQNADLDIRPQALFKQEKPVALVYSNRWMYYKWTLIKVASLLVGMFSLWFVIFKATRTRI